MKTTLHSLRVRLQPKRPLSHEVYLYLYSLFYYPAPDSFAFNSPLSMQRLYDIECKIPYIRHEQPYSHYIYRHIQTQTNDRFKHHSKGKIRQEDFLVSFISRINFIHLLGYDLRHYRAQHHAFIKHLRLPAYLRFDTPQIV